MPVYDGEPIRKEIYDLPRWPTDDPDERWENDLAGWLAPKLYLSPSSTRVIQTYRTEYKVFNDIVKNATSGTHYQPPNGRDFLRTELIHVLEKYPGHLGNPGMHNFLMSHNVQQKDVGRMINKDHGLGWAPIHNRYYESSILTINVETQIHLIAKDQGHIISEKVWDPIIKGHFILTFGFPGMYEALKHNYGIKLPEWINYSSFDSADMDDLTRWLNFIIEVKRVLNLGKQLYHYRIQDLELLKYNRELIRNSNYRGSMHSVIQNLCDYVKQFPHYKEIVRDFLND
jgi:hypothetical protein